MKIAYLKRTRCNAGGTERVVFNKTNYLIEKGYDVTLITTELKDKPDFLPFSPKLKRVDLDINYMDLNGAPFYKKIIPYFFKTRTHKQRLKEVLMQEKFDVVVSMFGNEVYWINDIKDGSKKINEVHFSRWYRINMNKGKNTILNRLISFYRDNKDIKTIKKFDKLIVLTNEDKPEWGDLPNVCEIYNGISILESTSQLMNKRAIAVGCPSYVKGFDMLIQAWALVFKTHSDWTLDIYTSADEKEKLQSQIDGLGLHNIVILRDQTPEIIKRITDSSIYLMTSRYEGLPMVLLEANACGVPAVSFACKCGPRDIITDGQNGFLVPQDDIDTFAQRVCRLIENEPLRKEMGAAARKNIEERFSEEIVMRQWEELFAELVNNKS